MPYQGSGLACQHLDCGIGDFCGEEIVPVIGSGSVETREGILLLGRILCAQEDYREHINAH